MVEPAVQGVDPVRAPEVERVLVAGARDPHLPRHAARLQRLPPDRALVEAHVVVLRAVGDEHRGAHLVDVLEVVAVEPELVDVAVLVAVGVVHHRARVGAQVAAIRVGDLRLQRVAGVVVVVPDAARAGVLVPLRDRRDRHDRGQALDAGGGDAVGERAVVGLADHRRLAVVPRRGDRVAVLVEAGPAAVEPVDHGLHALDVARAAVHRAAGRVAGAVHLRVDEGVAARDEVVVVEQRPAVVEAVAVDVGGSAGPRCRGRASCSTGWGR